MCAIVDANVASLIFRKEHGKGEDTQKFYDRIQNDKLRIVTGGKNKNELFNVGNAKEWVEEAYRSGRVHFESDNDVNSEVMKLKNSNELKSDDAHVIALAKVSGARLLCTKDKDLTEDFKNANFLSPKGKVYTIRNGGKFDNHHKGLLDNNNCIP